MDAAPESFPYRCLPLNIANAHGWELLSPCGVEAGRNGGPDVHGFVMRPDPHASEDRASVGLLGQGVLTFHLDGLSVRHPAGISGSAARRTQRRAVSLSGVTETDDLHAGHPTD